MLCQNILSKFQNAEVHKIAALLIYRRLRRLGHVARMDKTRLPLQMMSSTLEGCGARIRPLKSWNDYVREHLMPLDMLMIGGRFARTGKTGEK